MLRKNKPKTHTEHLKKHANFLLSLEFSNSSGNSYEQLMKSLAFVYHLLKFNIAHYNIYGDTNSALTTNLRNYLTHFAAEIALDYETISAAHQHIKEHLQVSSCSNICWLQETKLYANLKDAIPELNERIHGNKQLDHAVFKVWMQEKIIPLINRLNMHDACSLLSQEEREAAFKMVVIIFGEYCKINRQRYFKKMEKDQPEIADFILFSCKLRNIYAHDVVEVVGLLYAAVIENAALINQSTVVPDITHDLLIPAQENALESQKNNTVVKPLTFTKQGAHLLTFRLKNAKTQQVKSVTHASDLRPN